MIKKIEKINFDVEDDMITTLALHVNEIRHVVNELIEARIPTQKEEPQEEPQEEWPQVVGALT